MDTIVKAALIGTARQENIEITTGTPVDELMANLSSGDVERKLLLSAGAWAVYRQAGRVPETIPTLPEPALPETLRPCPASTAPQLYRLFLGEYSDLLPEVLRLLRQAGMHIPHALLPSALNMPTKEVRAALLPVLGERGRWLSQFNPAWAWVHDYLPDDDTTLPLDAETIWQEGSTARRSEILRRLRALDPAQAREWLEAVWKQEKAEVRAEFLRTCEVNLSLEDEPFLEKALDDRAASVRALACNLLACLPASAFADRMRVRADAMLMYAKDKFTVRPPAVFDKAWARDGIAEKPVSGLGERTWWLIQALSFVSPTHWETQLGGSPGELIILLQGNKWENSLLEGWSRAALLHKASGWLGPLWNWWQEQQGKKKLGGTTTSDMRDELLAAMPQQQAEQKLHYLFAQTEKPEQGDWEGMLAELPTPWSEEFGRTYLRHLNSYLTTLQFEKGSYYPYYDAWYNSLKMAAHGLPAACIPAALEPWALPESTAWQVTQWREQLLTFTATLRLRQRFLKEII